MPLLLTYAGGRYDRTDALRTREVRPNGVDLHYLALPVEAVFYRMLGHLEFDASEMSLASYAIALDRGTHDLVALPIFPSRSFRLSCIYVREDSPLTALSDLRGRRVGLPEYQMTAAVWQRGMLAEHFGVPLDAVQWVTARPEKVPIPLPSNVERYGGQGSLEEALLNGAIDALMAARMPEAYRRRQGLRRLLADSRALEQAYFHQTGLFPIMHTVVVKGELYRRHPWLGSALMTAFCAAKQQALDSLYDTTALTCTLPWLVEELEATRQLMGNDFWADGFRAGRHNADTLLRYLHEQGLTGRRLQPEDLFAPNLLDT